MKEIKMEKLTLNIGLGEPGEVLEKAKKVIEDLTGGKAVKVRTKRRNTFGVPKGKEIGVKITLRKEKIMETLKKLLEAKEYKIRKSSFSDGTFSFGIEEHIDIPGLEYDPKTGIFGMNISVTLERPGFRIKRKKISKKIGKKHEIGKQETMDFAKKKLGVKII